MTTIPLTVLLHDGPIGRAYLTTLRRLGLQPAMLILLVYKHGPTGKAVGRWWPGKMRVAYAERIQEVRLNYWARRLRKEFGSLVESMINSICDGFELSPDFHDEMFAPKWKYEQYSPHVRRAFVSGLNDPQLVDLLTDTAPAAVLYTGGGIVPSSLLCIAALRFVHVHPGLLPQVRGADGLLWSTLVRGRPGATCIYMESGIDEGEIIWADEFEPPALTIPPSENPTEQDLYRAIYAFYDPIIRARVLRRVFSLGLDLAAMRSKPQRSSSEATYRFMHPCLRRKALQQIFSMAAPVSAHA